MRARVAGVSTRRGGGGGTGTVPGAASRARTAVGGLGGGDNTA